jgi:hypothetical protein
MIILRGQTMPFCTRLTLDQETWAQLANRLMKITNNQKSEATPVTPKPKQSREQRYRPVMPTPAIPSGDTYQAAIPSGDTKWLYEVSELVEMTPRVSEWSRW